MTTKLAQFCFAFCIVAGLTLVLPSIALADCSPNGTGNDDIITCSGQDLDGINAGAGNDQITVQPYATVANINGTSIQGGEGDDLITADNATPAGVDDKTVIDGGKGDDIIDVKDCEFLIYITSGAAPGETNEEWINRIFGANIIDGSEGDDTVTLSGSVGTLQEIDGGEGEEDQGGDTLNFNLSTADETTFDNAVFAINTAINNGHADGEFDWPEGWYGSGRIKWMNFENLINNMVFTGVRQRDLEAEKSNNVEGVSAVGISFNWTVTVSNTGEWEAIFRDGQTIIIDELPGGPRYGVPEIQNVADITNHANINCEITVNSLTCTVDGNNVTIDAKTGTFDVVFSVSPLEPGYLYNPREEHTCQVDPDDNMIEADETNNDCTDLVVVGHGDGNPLIRNFSIGSGGGVFTSNPVRVVIPENLVPAGSYLVIEELNAEGDGNFRLGNRVFDIKIYGPDRLPITSFEPPLKVCIMPTYADLEAAGWIFQNLSMFHQHAGSSWGRVVNTYQEDGYLCADISQLSLFAIGVADMPDTGFAPGMLHTAPQQPDGTAYTAYDDFLLEIPSLGLEMSIVGVPLTEKGWDVTWLEDQAGYLEGTAYPTWVGNTAITGHVWNKDNTPGPFVDIQTLQHGDQVIIRAWGMRHIYEVIEIMQVKPDTLSALPHSEYDLLTLITCMGFDEFNGEYDWRLAVQAVLMKVEAE
ncbi:MAG: sortase [Anaerolineales bacterium]|nr:sortase [Chloroflexota bacterium]MBL6983894.1 sortase [Anaerolineales bacterium]